MVGFFEEAPGVKSLTRVIFGVGMIWLMAVCTAMLFKGVPVSEVTILFGTVSTVLAGTKLIQKAEENKNAQANP